jgi:hypothetical protein
MSAQMQSDGRLKIRAHPLPKKRRRNARYKRRRACFIKTEHEESDELTRKLRRFSIVDYGPYNIALIA